MPTIIFSDGASSGNPGPGGWGTIISTPDGHIRELGGGERSTTNNRMEMVAALVGLEQTRGVSGETIVYTDSTYLIRGITQWVFAWRNRNWKTAEGQEVLNQDIWQKLMAAVAGRKISWRYVPGHSGVPGNERVDEIAVQFSKGVAPSLYRGPRASYPVDLDKLPQDFKVPDYSNRSAAPKTPFGYLSLVAGKVVRHKTWPECEQRVKGASGAKYKKVMSAAEEQEVLRSWGFPPGFRPEG